MISLVCNNALNRSVENTIKDLQILDNTKELGG